jgi:hypothetical protein
MALPTYAWREDLYRALDYKLSSRDTFQADSALDSASRTVEATLNRVFYPTVATRYKDWPNPDMGLSYRIWLDADELISLTSMTVGGTSVTTSNYLLEPANYGPPYDRIEVLLSGSGTFGGGSTHQRAVALTGVFGWTLDSNPAGTLAAAITTTTATTCTVSDGSLVGVGALLTVDTERMVVTARTTATTGLTVTTTASNADVTWAVSDGTAVHVGETLLVDSERAYVTDIAGNNVTVKRAWDGTVLAAHTGATIYAYRALTITRGALGTTAATHSNAATITTQAYPGPVKALTLAEAVVQLGREGAGYTATARSKTSGAGGDPSGAAGGISLGPIDDIRRTAMTAYGRQARKRAI